MVSIFLNEVFSSWKHIYRFWHIAVLYSGFLLFSLYVYQFPEVQAGIQNLLNLLPEKIYLTQGCIGLYPMNIMILEMLPYTVVLFLAVLQLYVFQSRKIAERSRDLKKQV